MPTGSAALPRAVPGPAPGPSSVFLGSSVTRVASSPLPLFPSSLLCPGESSPGSLCHRAASVPASRRALKDPPPPPRSLPHPVCTAGAAARLPSLWLPFHVLLARSDDWALLSPPFRGDATLGSLGLTPPPLSLCVHTHVHRLTVLIFFWLCFLHQCCWFSVSVVPHLWIQLVAD